MWTCPVCESEYVITQNLCDDCKKIKHCMNLYSKEEVLDVLEKVLVRQSTQIKNRVEREIKENKEEITK